MISISSAIAVLFLSPEMCQPAADTPWAHLLKSFQQAKPPKPGDLPGEWVQTQNVSTSKFINGKDGPDFVQSDIQGIRRKDLPGGPLEWRLSINVAAGGRLQLTSHTAWVPTGDVSVASFNSQGDLIFGKDYGGDSMWIYRCRSASATNLVCVMKNPGAGHAIEFHKTN
jgi:hypothetical protein